MGWPSAFWTVTGAALHMVGAVGCLLALVWLWQRADRTRPDFRASMIALGLTALWGAVVVAYGPASHEAVVAEMARNLGWIAVIYRLFAMDGRDRSLGPIRPVIGALALVEMLHAALLLADLRLPASPELNAAIFQTYTLFRILVAVGALMLLHNLWLGAGASTRQVLLWSGAALAGLWAFDLNLYTIGYLSGEMPQELAAMRGLVSMLMAVALAIGANTAQAKLRLRPSRVVAFRTLSLFIIGSYLIAMVGIAQAFTMLGGDFARLAQTGFILAAIVAALLWLPSAKLRGWARVTLAKHLFQHRYDYRAEWMRFTQTIGETGEDTQTLHQRVVKVVADITESASGFLLLPGDNTGGEPAARWNWDGTLPVGQPAIPPELSRLLEQHKFIVDLDDVRTGSDQHGEGRLVPDWLVTNERAWVIVPLLHFERLMGIVVVARPPVARALDWEDFDLLRIVGQQLASYLAEQAGEQALMEAARFDEFNRRIAFVIHDIKNLASQLSLLAGNAERHAEKPEFRADMLVTLRNSADKLNALLSRLARYNANPAERREATDLRDIGQRVIARFQSAHRIDLIRFDRCEVLADPEALEQSLVHLVQNAVDASDESSPIALEISSDGLRGMVQVVDSGSGMSAQFIREDLFRPFVSTRNGGFGVGAFEARELIRAMGGQLDVDSRPGLGTRFTVTLPMVDAAQLIAASQNPDKQEVA